MTVPLGAEIASHVGAFPLRAIFVAFLIATVGWAWCTHATAQTSRRHRYPIQRSGYRPAGRTRPQAAVRREQRDEFHDVAASRAPAVNDIS